jgi:hypothetical protein
MLTKIKKTLIAFLVFAGLVLYVQPAHSRGGGSGGSGGAGFRGGGSFSGARTGNFNNGGFGGPGVSQGTGGLGRSGVSRYSTGGLGRDGMTRYSSDGLSNDGLRPVGSGGFHGGGFNGGRSGMRNDSRPDRSFNDDSDSRPFNNRVGRVGDRRSGGRNIDRGNPYDNRNSFSRYGDYHRHNDCRDRYFYNPCYGGYVYGWPFYGYYYYYSPGYTYGDDSDASEDNSYNRTYKYSSEPVDEADNTGASETSTSVAENFFNEGVRMFGNSDYSGAAKKFGAAKYLVPQDKFFAFAYAQAVFASGDYISAAAALREAIAKITPETEGIFYPRGMYYNEAVIKQQIKTLAEKAQLSKNNVSLQLLLGYNELGMNNLDNAEAALKIAAADRTNGSAAEALLKLIERLRTQKAQTPDTQSPDPETVPPEIPKEEMPAN